MSIRRVIKLMERVREVAKMGGLTSSDIQELTGEYGEAIRDRLIAGLVGGYDIEGHQFKGLKDSTKKVRQFRGISGSTPLRAGGGIESFLESSSLFRTEKAQVSLNEPPEEYMKHQNKGFEPRYIPGVRKDGGVAIKKNGEIAFVANRVGISVPARKWYGIPKTYREGGMKYNEFLKKFVKRIEERLTKALKFT